METLFTYFIKVSVLVSLFYLSYWFLLKKETFFSKNRMFLLLGLVTSLVLPLVTITKTVWIEPEPLVFQEPVFIPDFPQEIAVNHISGTQTEINWTQLIAGFYFLGALFFFVKFVLSSLSLYKILHKSPIQKQDGFKFIDSKNVKTPFSFFNYIAFDSSSFSGEELQSIITHEKTHCKQKHSLDILLSEVFLIVLWFNPFVWLYKKAIQQNLEFIADSNAVKASENKINYQKALLKATLNPRELALTNSFFQPLIKKRIIMLNKNQSKNRNLWKYAFILPLLAVFVMQFQTKAIAQTKESKTFEPAKEEQYLVAQDTAVWVKDFAKSYEEEKAIVSIEEETEHLGSKKKPLYIINGEEIPKEKTNGIWHLEGEVSVTEYDKKEAVEKFGEKGKDGVVVLEGKVVNLFFQTKEKELINFLKTVKDYKLIDIYNGWGNLVYTLKPNEKLDEEKLNALENGTYLYTLEKNSGEKVSGYLHKGNDTINKRVQEAERRAKEAQKRAEDLIKQRTLDAEQRAEEAQQRIMIVAERRAKEAQKRAEDMIEQRTLDAEQRVKDAQKRAEDAKQRAFDAEQRTKDAEIRLEERQRALKEREEKRQ